MSIDGSGQEMKYQKVQPRLDSFISESVGFSDLDHLPGDMEQFLFKCYICK